MRLAEEDGYIQTFSGRRFYFGPNFDSSAIDIRDVAHALSLVCRWTGHIRRFYSVAEHSWYVSTACPTKDALWGLLHDASEAYIADVARPVKHLPAMAAYRELEAKIETAIFNKFGLYGERPPSVTAADNLMLITEARDLIGPVDWDTRPYGAPYHFHINPWTPQEAEDRFLQRFTELTLNKTMEVQ